MLFIIYLLGDLKFFIEIAVQLVKAAIPHFCRFSKLCCFGFDFMFPTTSTFSGMASTCLYINDQGQKTPSFNQVTKFCSFSLLSIFIISLCPNFKGTTLV